MAEHQRFSIDENSYIIDRLNPGNSGKLKVCFDQQTEDEKSLRDQLLLIFLGELVGHLIVNTNPTVKHFITGEQYQPSCEERHTISWALYEVIQASHLNTLDVARSREHRFSGELKREKKGMQDFTSLALFVDDLERLLRDLYGDGNNEAIDLVRSAIFAVVQGFTQFVRKDLWQEHLDAQNIDYSCGIGVLEGYCLSGSDYRRAMCAADDLAIRARNVRINPSAFSKYTVAFAKVLAEEWPRLGERSVMSDEEIARLEEEMERVFADEPARPSQSWLQ